MSKKKENPGQVDLAPVTNPIGTSAVQVATPGVIPRLVEYSVGGDVWRVGRFDLLAADFDFPTAEAESGKWLVMFHEALSANARPWMFVRRLFGIRPIQTPKDFSQDDARWWDREELAAAQGITRAQLQQEVDVARGIWQAAKPAPELKAVAQVEKPFFTELQLTDDDKVVREYGFPPLQWRDTDERNWFVGTVRDFDRVLKEKMSKGLAIAALMLGLRIRRLDIVMEQMKGTGGKDWVTLMKTANEMAKQYNDAIEQIVKLCPWASQIAGKYSFQAVVSEITQAILEYQSRSDTKLIDGIFTLTEIQVECRRSVQVPEPRYRAGLRVHLTRAKAELFNPHFKQIFPPAMLAKMDTAWREAFLKASEQAGEHVPDLTKDGPEGEFAELEKAEETIPE